MGVETEGEIDRTLKKIFKKLRKIVCAQKVSERLKSPLVGIRGDFSYQTRARCPAKVEPLRIHLKLGQRPIRATQRQYAPPKRIFISSTIQTLNKIGAVFPNLKSKWACPALAVAKQGQRSSAS